MKIDKMKEPIRLLAMALFLSLLFSIGAMTAVQAGAEQAADSTTNAEPSATINQDITDDQSEPPAETVDPEVLDKIEEYNRLQEEQAKAAQPKGNRQLAETIQPLVEQALNPNRIPIDIMMNNKYVKGEGYFIQDQIYVPLRTSLQLLNVTQLEWDSDRLAAAFQQQDKTIEILLNTNQLYVNQQPLEVKGQALLINKTMYVPADYIEKIFGFQSEWDNRYKTLLLTNPDYSINLEYMDYRNYTYGELQTFAKLIMKEAGGVSYETKHGVASVIMNQIAHSGLGSTLTEVIFAVSASPHFPPAHQDRFFDTIPNTECVKAAKMVLRGENSAGDCIYFNTRPFKGTTIYKVVDGVYFCY